jgi:hypothetical protein
VDDGDDGYRTRVTINPFCPAHRSADLSAAAATARPTGRGDVVQRQPQPQHQLLDVQLSRAEIGYVLTALEGMGAGEAEPSAAGKRSGVAGTRIDGDVAMALTRRLRMALGVMCPSCGGRGEKMLAVGIRKGEGDTQWVKCEPCGGTGRA